MTGLRRRVRSSVLVLATVAGTSVPAGVVAQRLEDADFLFERPSVSLIIRGGMSLPSASSEIFAFTSEQLTLDTRDFYSPAMGVEGSFRITNRFDVALGAAMSQSTTRSEFRDFVDLDDQPIEQTTKFTRVPITLSLKYFPMDRGRQIGRFAWITQTLVPYLGVGGGVIWYEFDQQGEWVDFSTLDIFRDVFKSAGTTGVAHLLAGVEISLGPQWFLNGEGRYSFASTRMDQDFVDFDDIDLGGFEATVGFALRF